MDLTKIGGLVVIKPSGVGYKDLKIEDMVIVDLDGKIVVKRTLKPSVDTHHLYLYRNIPSVGGVIHTHSPYAVKGENYGFSI